MNLRKQKTGDKQEKPEKKLKKEKGSRDSGQKVKKVKSDACIMRKNTGMKILRAVFWTLLVFVFVKGVISCVQRDKEAELNRLIYNFKQEYSRFNNENGEVMAFAQNFAREYLTYTVKGEEDYKNRLAGYVSTTFFNSNPIDSFNAAAEAVYVQAYRIEDYSSTQKDVYVLAKVRYTTRTLTDGSVYTDEYSTQDVTLKVPVYCADNKYAVENVPLVVSDSRQIAGYKGNDYYGEYCSEAETAAMKTSVDNFLEAYCEQDTSVINYYLAPSADKEDFAGLGGRYTYQGISVISCYHGAQDFVCLVEYKIKDAGNGVVMTQKINLTMSESGGKYYIKSMDTRTGNLNIN